MPSRYEPWGLVFPEAMSHGVACIGSETGAIPEILGHGEAGLTVASGDAGALATALLAVLGDDALAQRLAAAGRRRVETELLWDHVAEAASYIPTSSGPTTPQS